MIVLCALVLLVTYVTSYVRSARRGFSKSGANVLVLVSGVLLLVPLAMLASWYYMVYDWPMGLGGKPNWTFYHNEPYGGSEIVRWFVEHPHGILCVAAIVIAGIAASFTYASFRMIRACRSRSGGA